MDHLISPLYPFARLGPETLARAIIQEILTGRIVDRQGLNLGKSRLAKELGLSRVPSSSFILAQASPDERNLVRDLLIKKPTRTASGVATVTVQTSPVQSCPGRCIYCPDFPSAPKSYTGREPASMRAFQCRFDPYQQVVTRIRQMGAMGHSTSKVELIVQGATFPAMDLEYRRWFVARCLDGMIGSRRSGFSPRSLGRAMKASERASARPIGVTFETRPDWCSPTHVEEMLNMGATRVEIGVQTLSDRVHQVTGRGHAVSQVEDAFRALRTAGLKICAHMMVGLPGSDEEEDLRSFRTLFEDSRFRPDELKIYPTLVIPGTGLHQLWRAGDYDELREERLIRTLLEVKSMVPPWMRIKRVMRDIPSGIIAAGPRRSDIRMRVQAILRDRGRPCRCIRCREVSRQPEGVDPNLALVERRYDASGSQEVFLSFEDGDLDVIAAFLRLSISPDFPCRVRELHTYGRSVRVGGRPSSTEWQHRGMGKSLLARAEEIARDAGGRRLDVTSGVGAREYYRRQGYRLRDSYMSKAL